MPFKINFNASNFVSSIVSDVKGAVKGAIGDTINQKLGSLGPLGKLAANFINQTGGFGSSINNRTISRVLLNNNIRHNTNLLSFSIITRINWFTYPILIYRFRYLVHLLIACSCRVAIGR